MQSIISQIPSRNVHLKGQQSLDIGYPWLSFGAIIALEKILTKEMKVLELGSGGSTVFWAKNCMSVKSYETDPGWYKSVKTKTKIFNNVEIMLCNRHGVSVGLRNEPDNYYDIVLIDSEPKRTRRLDLANMAVPKVKPGGWMIVDNYQSFGMYRFDYSKWQVYTFDEFHWVGMGTRLCKKI